MNKKISAAFLAVILVSSVTLFPAYATPAFSAATNLSGTGTVAVSNTHKITSSGSNVYVAWNDGTSVLIRASTDNGANFGLATTLDSTTATLPDIAASGSNVYAVWRDNGAIVFNRSTDNGANFGTATTLSGASTTATNPRIAASGANVYVIWDDGTNLRAMASSDNGANFSAEVTLSSTVTAATPRIAASGATAFVVWRDTSVGTGDILFNTVSNAGAAGASVVNLSASTGSSVSPQIGASGTMAYVAWRDLTPGATGDIFFSAVSDTGTISVSSVNLSNNAGTSTNPSIDVDSNDVYVAWQDNLTSGGTNFDIFLRHSSNNGVSFDSQVNLSNTNTASSFPSITALGNDVNVAWTELVATPSNTDVLFRTSPDKTATFGGLLNLSGDATASNAPIVDTTSTNVNVIWRPTTPSDVMISSGAISAIDVRFDATQYNIGSTATITVNDPAANTSGGIDTVSVAVASTLPAGIASVILSETSGTSGVFTNTLSLTTSVSSGTPCSVGCSLQVGLGNTVTATYSGRTTNAFMQSRTIDIQFATYTLNDGRVGGPAPVLITLTDSASNTDTTTVQTVDATITSTSQPGGITLRLTEASANSNTFTNTNLIFMTGNAQYATSNTVTISQLETDPALNFGANGVLDTLGVTVRSTTDAVGFTMTLSETGINTALFTGVLSFSTAGPSGGSTIQVSAGDIVSVGYNAAFVNSQIIPNSNLGVGSIQAAVGDTITASFGGATDTATMVSVPGGGGGGGGVVRPTVVVNAIAGLFGGGGGSSSSVSISSSSLESLGNPAEGLGGKLSGSTDLASLKSTKTVSTGEKLVLRLDITSNKGIDYLTHVELGVNNKGDKNIASDTSIIYDKFNPKPVRIVDPHGLFKDAKFELLPVDPRTGVLKFEITFAKSMDTSDIRLLMWDVDRNFAQKFYEDAIKVEKSSTDVSATELPVLVEPQKQKEPQKTKLIPQKTLKKEKDSAKLKDDKKQFDKLKKKKALEKQTKKTMLKKMQKKI